MKVAPLTVLLYLVFAFPARADGPTFGIEDQARQFLVKHCLPCHGSVRPKANLRLDKLTGDFADASNRERWLAVRKRVTAGEMPPKDRPRPSSEEMQAIGGWIATRADAADAARRAAEGRVVWRRLNRIEYERSVCDLLGVNIDLRELLPTDATGNGFDTSAEAHHLSSFLMDRYLEAADRALAVAIANTPQPKEFKKRMNMKEERNVKTPSERVFRPVDEGVIMFTSSPWQAITMYNFYPPDRGRYRFRISAQAVQSKGKPVSFRVDAGPMLMGTKNHLVDYYDAPADKPKVFEFVDNLEARSTLRILPYGLDSAQAVNKVGAESWEGPGLMINWVDVEGPLHDAWPPASHRQLFGDLKQGPSTSDRYRLEVIAKDPEADAARILKTFARRAFRRPVTDAEMKPYLALVKARLGEQSTFEQAVRVGLKAILVSPDFLFLREKPGKLDDFALASRLSYFLWSSTPDEELFKLAEAKKLAAPETLRDQLERMLKDPRAAAFTENFVGQWLGLRDIDATAPDFLLYPDFDDLLKASMLKETQLFFNDLLANDRSVTNFVACDFTYLNARLAKHYGIPGVEGQEFKKVTLPPGSHRGGVLTMASVLKVTANGTNTSPVVRGAWVLDRILGKPPAPPPAGVPAIEPDIRGATTIRQQLAKHRQIASCATCHTHIDPPGFALENFDVIGGWRENYRVLGNGEVVMMEGRRMPFHKGKKVDPADTLADGQKFRDIDELKTILLKDKDQLARALTEKLLTYATGAPPTAADRAEVDAIVRDVSQKDYGLRAIVHAVVQSKTFQTK